MADKVAPLTSSITIEVAAQSWLKHLQTRRRRPIKPSSTKIFESSMNKWILPCLGNLEVSSIGVAVLRNFIGQLDEAGLSPKTQNELVSCVKGIITHCSDLEGNPLYPAAKMWSSERLDLPVIKHSEQRTPVVSREDIEGAITKSNQMYRCLLALAAGSGLRIGELLSIKLTDDGTSSFFDTRNALIRVRRTMWRSKEQTTKTDASTRDVEIPYKLSEFVAEFAGARTGFLFGNGKCLDVTSARNALDSAIGKGIGYHAFRRFYISWCRANAMPEDILKRLVGHSTGGDITSRYNSFGSQSAERRIWIEKIGLGFRLPQTKLNGVPLGK
jgi:integrase